MLSSAERAEILVKRRGYIVLGSISRHYVGEIIYEVASREKDLGGELPTPFAITRETDIEDAREQQKILIEHGDDPRPINVHAYWYRLSTD